MTPANTPAPASPERLLRGASAGLRPSAGAQDRVRRMVASRMRSATTLRRVRDSLVPDAGLLARVWNVVSASVAPAQATTAWEKLRDALAPAEAVRAYVWSRITPRMQPAYVSAFASRRFKWGVAVAVVVITARLSPLLFLAPPTIAESSVTLLSTRGAAEVLSGSLWQPVKGEVILARATTLQTQSGEATLILHDDAVIRLAPHTRVTLYDLSDRPERGSDDATLALERGKIWVLGLVPKHVRGLSVVTSQGRVFLHEGSVSVEEGADVKVAAWDRSAVIARRGKQIPLYTGQHVSLARDGSHAVGLHHFTAFEDDWVALNLGRDAAHRRDIAQLQQERRAASAGILPGSAFYPVKRFAEQVDVLMTFGEEQKAKKRITQANTRLNEAAALLADKQEAPAAVALQEYKDTVLDVASGSGSSAVVQSIIEEEVHAAPATVAAAIPGDVAYALKKTVDETIMALPETLPKPDLEADAILDELTAVKQQAEQGDTAIAKEKLTEIAAALGSGSLALSPESRQEVAAVAEQVAAVVERPVEEVLPSVPEIVLPTVVLPRRVTRNLQRPLTAEQVAAKAQEIRGRVFAFGTKKAQQNALRDQLSLLANHPDRGSILRELSKVMPRNGLQQRVLAEIRQLNDQVEQQITASGGTAVHAQ